MNSWLSRTQIQQRPMLAVYAGLLILIAAAIGGASLTWLTSRSDDRLAVISNFLALGTLLLALVAGIVALAAYSAATGLPALRLKFFIAEGNLNSVRFYTRTEPQGDRVVTVPFIASIIVQNTSAYSARTPAVIIELQGTTIRPEGWSDGTAWIATVRNRNSGEISAIQWDGGPNYAIHGKSIRHLPDLNLGGIIPREASTMTIRLLADGYNRPEITLPIEYGPPRQSHRGGFREWL